MRSTSARRIVTRWPQGAQRVPNFCDSARSAAALLALAALGCGTAPTPAAARAEGPPAIAIEGVPPIPREIIEGLARYQSMRGATFEDWGPDGSMLISTRFGELPQIHRVPFPGGRREQLTFGSEPVSNAHFIPATGAILYSQARGGDENWQVHRLDPKTGKTDLLTDGKSRHTMGPLSRKGDRLVVSTNRRNGRDMDLCLLDVKTGSLETLLETKGESWHATDWSPDDSKLLLLRVVSVNETHPHVLDLATRKSEPLLEDLSVRAAHSSLRFDQDGRRAFVASDAGSEFKRLHFLDLATKKSAVPLLRGSVARGDWDLEDIEVHGSRLAYALNVDGASALFVGDEVALPPGIVSGLTFSPDGKRLAFTLQRADGPADAWSFEVEDRKLVRWTYSETGGLPADAFVTPERITFPSFDGLKVPAWIYRPRGAAKAPVVISIHGGPESQSRPSFSPSIQHWVNELGLCVIVPNVRGSTGYGKTYVALDNAEKREDAVKDIGALLDWIGRQPGLDASRVAVHGGSYGGYMVLASLVHFGDRIRAGVDIVGIGNFVTFLEKTSGYRVDLRRVEYGDERKPGMRAFFERISPANHADRIRSALLVAHGRNDPRVPFFEAEQMAARVRAQGREVWTVYAANEGHGFARKENRDFLSAATALFFRKFLIE